MIDIITAYFVAFNPEGYAVALFELEESAVAWAEAHSSFIVFSGLEHARDNYDIRKGYATFSLDPS